MKFLYDERTRAVAAGAACLRVRHVSSEDELARLATEEGVQERMARREGAIIEQIVRECERAIEEDGAQAIVFGCTCMAPVGPQVAARLRVPVIEASRAGYLAAVATARRPPAALCEPRTARPTLIPSIVDASVAGAAGALAPASGECPVCIF
jgi:allantoin racemase